MHEPAWEVFARRSLQPARPLYGFGRSLYKSRY